MASEKTEDGSWDEVPAGLLEVGLWKRTTVELREFSVPLENDI